MGIKRPKKRPSLVGIKSDDKRARLEAGLDLQLNTDLSDTTLEHIVKEVVAPKSKLELLESWLTSVTSFLLNSPLPKAKTSSIAAPPCALPKEGNYPGARLLSCKPVGTLALPTTLVFPNAVGSLQVEMAFAKPPTSSEQLLTFWYCALAQIKGRLAASDLVESGSVFYELDLFAGLPSVQLRPAGKLGRHLAVSIALSMPDIQPCEEGVVALELASSRSLAKSLNSELRNLISSQPAYKTLLTALHIWARQVKLPFLTRMLKIPNFQVNFLSPHCFMETLVLHLHTTSLLAPHMKAWQGLRKLWSFLAASDFLNQDLILGVASPVPSSAAATCCPILDKAGTSPLFPLMTRAQWRLLVTFASAAQSQGVEKALLVSFKSDAFYDRIFEVKGCGRTSASDIVKKLVRGLVDRVNTVGLVGGNKAFSGEEDDSVNISIGLRLDPATYWQPTTLGPEASDEKACEEFRTFWGERSQLRRFHDGTVREVVVWGGAREELVGDLVRAVISRHFGGCQVEERGGWGEGLLQGDGGVAARAVLDTLVPVLYNLEGLPLAVAGVAGSGPAARGSRVGEATVRKAGGKIVREEEGLCKLTGKGGMAAASLRPLDVVLTAEHSGKWPKDVAAVRRLRAAWLAEVGKALAKKVPGLKAKLAGEHLLVLKDSTVLRLSVGERGEEGSECEVIVCQSYIFFCILFLTILYLGDILAVWHQQDLPSLVRGIKALPPLGCVPSPFHHPQVRARQGCYICVSMYWNSAIEVSLGKTCKAKECGPQPGHRGDLCCNIGWRSSSSNLPNCCFSPLPFHRGFP